MEMPGRVALHEAVWGKLASAEELPVSKYENRITALILLPEGKDTASYINHTHTTYKDFINIDISL